LKPALYHLNLFEGKKALAVRDFGKDFKKHLRGNVKVQVLRSKKSGILIHFFKGTLLPKQAA